jgi:hypothetical protein
MLAQILPGFREVRGPLASGFLWLLLAYLIFHADVASAHGKVKEIEELGGKLSPAALAVAATFVAYLAGSLSDDLFKRALSAAVRPFAGTATSVRDDRMQGMPESFRERQLIRLENEADRFAGESDLRISILPPFVVLAVYLALNESLLWLLGLIFAIGLGFQVYLRTRDQLVARNSLFESRRQVGIPPASAEEARAAKEAEKPNVQLTALDSARKGRALLNDRDGIETEAALAWADQASAFLRDHATPEEATMFLRSGGDNSRATVEDQVRALERIATKYG